MFSEIFKKRYIYIFTKLKIAIYKKFKKYIFDKSFFTNCLCLFVINKIYMINEWSKNFCLIYVKMKKV